MRLKGDWIFLENLSRFIEIEKAERNSGKCPDFYVTLKSVHTFANKCLVDKDCCVFLGTKPLFDLSSIHAFFKLGALG